MRIDLNKIDREKFWVDEHIIIPTGESVFLVQPNPEAENLVWTPDNKHLRSSLWNTHGELISAGFPKFTNWGENPQNFPVPTSLDGCQIVEKLDGSLLIVSRYNNQTILRTRGNIAATQLPNGKELDIFSAYLMPKIYEFGMDDRTWNCSYLFEWTSPTQQIVIHYGDQPEWRLVGVVDHEKYTMYDQKTLDQYAGLLRVRRPQAYGYKTIDELLTMVGAWKGQEGVVVYSNKGQTAHKVKSEWYLAVHRMKTELSSFDKVLDLYFVLNRPCYRDFCQYVDDTFDYELMSQCRGQISKICDARKKVDDIINGMRQFISSKLIGLPTRQTQAELTLNSYGNTNRASFVFSLLDGKELTSDQIKKLYYQVLK